MEPQKKPLDIIEFDEASHTYTNLRKKQKYISATTLIGKFKEVFNAKEVAYEVTQNPTSQYFGMDPVALAATWDKGGKQAAEDGTAFHKKKEDSTEAVTPDYDNTRLTTQQRKIIAYKAEKKQSLTDYSTIEDGEHREFIVVLHEEGLAGQVDLVVFDGEYFDIYDYKTNKKLDPIRIKGSKYYTCNSYYKRGKGYKMLKYPLHDLKDCYIVHYTLQLSLYAYAIEKLTGKKARKLTLLHHPNLNGKIRENATEIPIPYLRDKVELMLQLWGGYAPEDFKPTNQQKVVRASRTKKPKKEL